MRRRCRFWYDDEWHDGWLLAWTGLQVGVYALIEMADGSVVFFNPGSFPDAILHSQEPAYHPIGIVMLNEETRDDQA